MKQKLEEARKVNITTMEKESFSDFLTMKNDSEIRKQFKMGSTGG